MAKFKILVIIPRYGVFTNKKRYDYFFPLGMGYIVAALKKEGYSVDCLNLNHKDGVLNDIINKWLDKKDYDFVGIGSNVLYYNQTKEIINVVRSHNSKPRIILGGTIITSEPFLIFNSLNPDFGIIDEGEETIAELLKSIEKNSPLKKVKGIIYKEGNGAVFTGKRTPPAINSIPFPDLEEMDYEEYLDNALPNFSYMHSVFDNPRIYYLIGSRSCPFNCTFCWHYDRHYRQRSVKNIMEELRERIKKYRINRIYVLDECFSIDRKRLTEFCKEISKLRKEVPWELKWVNSLRVSDVDEETLKMLKESGCDIISYGFESYSSEVLKSMKKCITPEQINNAIKKTFDAKIGIQGNFIFGDVAETKETANETLEYWKGNCEGQPYLAFIMPFPNSEIYQSCIERGIIKDRLEFIKNINGAFALKMTDKMSDKEFNQLQNDIEKALGKCGKTAKPLSVKKTKKNRYKIKVKCPYCNKEIEYGNFLIKNRFYYLLYVLCKECSKKFHIGNSLTKYLYKNYNKVKKLEKIKEQIIKTF